MDSFSRAMSHVDSLDLQAKKKGKVTIKQILTLVFNILYAHTACD